MTWPRLDVLAAHMRRLGFPEPLAQDLWAKAELRYTQFKMAHANWFDAEQWKLGYCWQAIGVDFSPVSHKVRRGETILCGSSIYTVKTWGPAHGTIINESGGTVERVTTPWFEARNLVTAISPINGETIYAAGLVNGFSAGCYIKAAQDFGSCDAFGAQIVLHSLLRSYVNRNTAQP